MRYLQLILIALGLTLALQTTVLAADPPQGGETETSSDSAPDDGTEPECD